MILNQVEYITPFIKIQAFLDKCLFLDNFIVSQPHCHFDQAKRAEVVL